MCGQGYALWHCVASLLDLPSVPPSRVAAPGIVKRRRVFSTGWRHPVENPGPRTGLPARTVDDEAPASSRQECPVHRWKAPRARGACSSSRKGRRRGPRPRACPRERHAEGPRPSPFQGGDRAVGASPRWSLQPAQRPPHDTRCPRGSGRVKQAHGCPEGRTGASGCGFGPAGPGSWNLGWSQSPSNARPRPRPGGGGATRTRWREIVWRGFGRAFDAGERSARAHAGPDPPMGRGSGGPRWCSWIDWVAEVDERRSIQADRPGSSSPAPRASGRAWRAKMRRKPGRGGESHLRASSDTGGGLPWIPRVPARRRRRMRGVRARGREHSAMEGVLAWCVPPSLTRRRPDRAGDPRRWGYGPSTGARKRSLDRWIRRGRTRTSEVVS